MTQKYSFKEKTSLLAGYYTNKAKNLFRDLKLSDPKAWSSAFWNLYGMGKTESGVQVSENLALNTSAYYCGVNIISSTIACALPLHLYKRKPSGGRKLITDHPAYYVLSKQPNPSMPASTYHETGMAHLLTWGNQYSEIVRNRQGDIIELWPITPDRVTVEWGGSDVIYRINVGGEDKFLGRDKILHIPGLGYNGFIGYSIVQKARESLGLTMAAEQFGSRWFGSGTNLGLILKMPRGAGPEVKKALREDVKQYEGLGKSHRFMVLEGGLEVEKIGIPPDDAQFLETRQFQIPEIARWLNIAPHLLKDLTQAHYNNIESDWIQFLKITLLPWIVRREQWFDFRFLTEKERRLGYYFKHSVEGLLRGDSESRAKFYQSLFQVASIKPNEIRELEDMDPVDGGDDVFIQMQYVPLSRSKEMIDSTIKQKEQPDKKEPEMLPEEEQEPDESNTRLLIDNDSVHITEYRAITTRDRISKRYQPLVLDAARRIVNKETKAIAKNAKRAGFKKWLNEFYRQMPSYIKKTMGPVLYSFIESVFYDAVQDIGLSPDSDLTDEMKLFIGGYTEGYMARHIYRSLGQVSSFIDVEDFDGIEQRMDEWQERRPDKIALEEQVRASNGGASFIYLSSGLSAVWRTRGPETCPYCRALEGKKIQQGSSFFSGDEEWEPKGAKNGPMKIRGVVQHPPLHQGCDCYIGL